MIHHSCDACKRLIDPNHALRYVVRMEVYAATEVNNTDESDDDRDHLLEIQDILEQMDDSESEAISGEVYQQLRFDLCPQCREKFLSNPISRGAATKLDFSEN